MTKRFQYFLVTLGIIAVDALTKWVVTQRFAINESLVVFPAFFQLVHVRNTGAAFGIGANSASPLVPMILNLGAMTVFVFVAIYAFRSPVTDRLLQIGLHLILGGAVGNLIDRFRFGSVVDFLDFYVGLRGHVYHWPAFNVADSAICIGIALLFLDIRARPAAEATT